MQHRYELNRCRGCGATPVYKEYEARFVCELCDSAEVKKMLETLRLKEAARLAWNRVNEWPNSESYITDQSTPEEGLVK